MWLPRSIFFKFTLTHVYVCLIISIKRVHVISYQIPVFAPLISVPHLCAFQEPSAHNLAVSHIIFLFNAGCFPIQRSLKVPRQSSYVLLVRSRIFHRTVGEQIYRQSRGIANDTLLSVCLVMNDTCLYLNFGCIRTRN